MTKSCSVSVWDAAKDEKLDRHIFPEIVNRNSYLVQADALGDPFTITYLQVSQAIRTTHLRRGYVQTIRRCGLLVSASAAPFPGTKSAQLVILSPVLL